MRKYHALDDALFLECVYAIFTSRSPLYEEQCGRHEQAKNQTMTAVENALHNARGLMPRQQPRNRGLR